jgi:hypothetical protein
VADLYDRSRPSYPEALVDDVVEYAGAAVADPALEIGAGTGKATVRSEDGVWSTEILGAAGFDGAEVRRYRWYHDYATDEYLALLGTHSACLVLDPPQRRRLLTEIGTAIDRRGGSFRMPYVTVLGLARAA